MKNMTKNKNKIYTTIILAVLIGTLASLRSDKAEYSYQISILERNAIYAVVTISMDLLTGFTGLFSLGQASFMTIGAYVMIIFTIPVGPQASVYYISDIPPVIANAQPPIPVALLLSGLTAAELAAPIGIPVLHLRSDYLAITTPGLSEIIRAFIIAPVFDTITNGSYDLKNISRFPSIFAVFGLAALRIGLVMLLVNSSYGQAFKSIREGEIAAQPMGINLFRYKELSLVISSFFTGVGGGMLVMFVRSINSKTFQVALVCDILLTVALSGIRSVAGSVPGSFMAAVGHETLRFLDDPLTIVGIHIPSFRPGFCMVIFPILLMVVVLFYSRSITGNREFSWEGSFCLIRGIPHKPKGKKKKASTSKKEDVQ